jgi:hypothetical protein
MAVASALLIARERRRKPVLAAAPSSLAGPMKLSTANRHEEV